MSILKVNTALFFVLALAISGGAYAQKLLTPHPRFHPLLSQPLSKHPGLKFHPHSEHYIYTHDTIQSHDKAAFAALVSKFKQTPDLVPITLQTTTKTTQTTTTPTTPTSQSSSQNSNPAPQAASQADLYLISKYWLQLLPDIKPGLLKCLAGPTAKSETDAGGDQFPLNCPSTLTWLKDQTQTTQETLNSSSSTQSQSSPSSNTMQESPIFSLPSSLYTKLYRCPSTTPSNCQPDQSKDCYCTNNPCSDCSDINCKCYSQSDLTSGPRFFTPGSIPSYFSYPNPSHLTDKFQTFNATKPISSASQPTSSSQQQSTSVQQNYLELPHFSFPLPHSSHTIFKTQNSIASSETKSLQNSPHWPQPNEINSIFSTNLQTNKTGYNSLGVLVSKILNYPTSFQTLSSSSSNNSETTTLIPNSPTQLFFFRYITTLYALLWSYSPDSLPLFPSNYANPFFPSSNPPDPLFHTHLQTQSS